MAAATLPQHLRALHEHLVTGPYGRRYANAVLSRSRVLTLTFEQTELSTGTSSRQMQLIRLDRDLEPASVIASLPGNLHRLHFPAVSLNE